MLRSSRTTAPDAAFLAARAEAIPIRSHSLDLITAAGSLNYSNPDLFFPEAARVLAPDGVLVVYDFSPGRSFTDSGALDEWFFEFEGRYPWPRDQAREISQSRWRTRIPFSGLEHAERFEIPLPMAADPYAAYMTTETNVAQAIARGTPREEIRSWCGETLAPVFAGRVREVVFRGYFACMTVNA